MGRKLVNDFKGVVRTPGYLNRADGSFYTADNLICDAPGVVRKRKGFSRQSGGTGGPIWKLLTSRAMGTNLVVHAGTSTSGTFLKYGDGSGALASLNTVDSTSVTRSPAERMQMAQCQRNHYLTGDEGVRRLESSFASGTVRYAGMPYGMPWPRDLVGAPGTLLADGYGRAYRVTWHRKDNDGVELGGPPTGRAVMRNLTGMTGYAAATVRNSRIRIYLPTEFGTATTALTTSYYWRLWGSLTANLSVSDPDDEMYLVAEAFVTAGDLALGYVDYTDSTPDSYLRGSPRLHTNQVNFPPGEEGLVQGQMNADNMPPRARDVAYWRDCMWYSDIDYRYSIFFQLLALPTDGDTFVIHGVTYTARNAPATATEFPIITGFASTLNNIERTAEALAAIICSYASSNVWGFYVSSSGQMPGGILLIDRNFSGFTANCSRTSITRPDLNATVTADNGSKDNGLAFSKPLRADAVPPQNVLTAGPANARVLRLIPFRDRLLVFTDYGIYNVTGATFADFQVAPFDLSFRLMCPEAVALCDDRVYAWCYEGIVEIDDGGVTVVSPPIELLLSDLLAASNVDSFASCAFAVAYQKAHRVLFFYPEAARSSGVLEGCGQWLSFDTRTRAWTSGSLQTKDPNGYVEQRTAGVVRWSDDLLVLGNFNHTSSDAYLFLERSANAAADYKDTDYTGTDKSVLSFLTTNWETPAGNMSTHFQNVTLFFEGGENDTYRPPPGTLSITFATDWTQSTSDVRSVSTDIATIFDIPSAVRRGTRLRFSLTHNATEHMGITGIEYLVSEDAGRTGRKT